MPVLKGAIERPEERAGCTGVRVSAARWKTREQAGEVVESRARHYSGGGVKKKCAIV